MFRLLAYLLFTALVFITTTHGQLDPSVCPDGPTGPNPTSTWNMIPPRFEVTVEYVGTNEVGEISQAFSKARDSVIFTAKQGTVELYWNFETNEQFEVLTAAVQGQLLNTCLRQVIDPNSQTSIIAPNTRMLKPSVLLGFDARNQPNPLWGVADLGPDELRGIPVKKYKSCFYVSDIKATVAATYYVSDNSLIQTYMPPGTNIPILVRIDVDIINLSGREKYAYNIFRYTPEPRRREERQALETPSGVFCPNRTQTIPVPSNIPERTSSNGELFVPNFNSSIVSSHGLYDTEFQFTRFDAWYADPTGGPEWLHFTEIHDFAIGLSYQFNHSTYQCTVRNLSMGFGDVVTNTGNPNLLQMGSPQHLFLMDDISYQFTGEKRCHERTWCHVWIGQKSLPNDTIEQREWYWAIRHNDEAIVNEYPAKLIIKQYRAATLFNQVEINIFNFRRRPMTIFEIDFTLANCYRALGPSQNFNLAVLSFKIGNDDNYPVFQNLNYLRLHIFETLIFTMFVRPIRISNLIVDQDGKDIIVTFTLLDTPPLTGPVDNPLKEASLDRIIERLSRIIDSEGLAFRGRYDTKQVILRARPDSLNVAHRSSETRYLSSGPKITGLWIGLIIAGLVIGMIGGFIVFRRAGGS